MLDSVAPDVSDEETAVKRSLVADALRDVGAEVLVATSPVNVRWLLGGRGRPQGCGTPNDLVLVLDKQETLAICAEAECPRLVHEERLGEIGVRIASYAPEEGAGATVARIVGERLAVGDAELESRLAPTRLHLDLNEVERLRSVARPSATSLQATIERLRPETSEREAAAELAFQLRVRGLSEERIWVAGDVRQRTYGLTFPSSAPLGRHFLLGHRAEQHGLYASLVRVVSFGPPPAELRWVVGVTSRIQERMHDATEPGSTTDRVVAAAADAYVSFGFPDEWQKYCLGGLGGYTHPDVPSDVRSSCPIPPVCAAAWRPSLRGGGCSHDTALVTASGWEILTLTSALPATRGGIVEL